MKRSILDSVWHLNTYPRKMCHSGDQKYKPSFFHPG